MTTHNPLQYLPPLLPLLFMLTACAMPGATTPDSATAQVLATEQAFAATMAARDFGAFGEFVDDEAIFIEGPQPLRGKQQIIAAWQAYFEGPQAPFSWAPDHVEVLRSGTLAHSSGPVYNAAGEAVARFNSIWRLDRTGRWKIIFDKGSPLE